MVSSALLMTVALNRLLAPAVRLLEALLSVLMITLVAVTFVQVVLRYGFNSSLFWAEEFIRFNFTWIILLSAGYGTEKHAHFAVDAFSKLLPVPARRAMAFLASIVVLAVSAFFLVYGLRFALENADQASMIMRVPMTVVYISIPSAAVVMVLASVRDLTMLVAGQRLETTERGMQ